MWQLFLASTQDSTGYFTLRRAAPGANPVSAFVEHFKITSTGNVIAGAPTALATNATDGFLYIPMTAGTPTGVPTAQTGKVPLVYNTTGNLLCVYVSGAWRCF